MWDKLKMENFILVKNKVGNIFNNITGSKNIIKEGLIKTYPIEKLYKHAIQYCNFASSVKQYNEGNYQGVIGVVNGENGTKAIKIVYQKGNYNNKLLDNMFNTYGYFKSNEEKLDENFVTVEYESKFDELFKQQLLKKQFIYHLTTEKKCEKILKEGIKVHTGKENFNYPSRTYFFTDLFSYSFLKEFYNEKLENNKNIIPNKIYKISLILLEIDIQNIIDKVKFYNDPNMVNGIYTEDYIPPEIIKIKKKINYKIIKDNNGNIIEK